MCERSLSDKKGPQQSRHVPSPPPGLRPETLQRHLARGGRDSGLKWPKKEVSGGQVPGATSSRRSSGNICLGCWRQASLSSCYHCDGREQRLSQGVDCGRNALCTSSEGFLPPSQMECPRCHFFTFPQMENTHKLETHEESLARSLTRSPTHSRV